MLQITITEIDTDEELDIEETAEAITHIEKAEEILNNLLHLGMFENDQSIENRLTEISTLLSSAQRNLHDSLGLVQL